MTFANRDVCGVFSPMRDSIAKGTSTQRAHPHSTVPARGITAPVPKPTRRGGIVAPYGQVRTADSVLEAVNGAAVPPLTTMEVDTSDEAGSISC